MRVTVIGSGSRGNATLFDAGPTRVLVDAGLSARTVAERTGSALGRSLDRLDAIVVTHSHGDHVAHLRALARRFAAPVYVSDATRRAVFPDEAPPGDLELRSLVAPGSMRVGALELQVLPIPHDVPQVALVVRHGHRCVGLVTDLGHVPKSLAPRLAPCDTLLLEANHCPELLALSDYPASVQARIGSRYGHLSNAQAAGLLKALPRQRLRRVVLMHLSEQCNTPARALAMAVEALGPARVAGGRVQIECAAQDTPMVLEGRHATQLCLF